MLVSNPDVLTLEKHIDLRDTDAMVFSDHMYNFAFEFVKFVDNKFEPFEVPENIALFEAELKTDIYQEDGTFEEIEVEIKMVDCRLLHPELITESIMVGGTYSRMYCLDNEVAKVQGREYFNSFSEIHVKIDHCDERRHISCD